MSLNGNESTTHAPGSDRRLSIPHPFSATPPTLGSNQLNPDGDPHHQRTLSFSEIHQELEQEQEAQVNRMMQMIRKQQRQLELMHGKSESDSRQNSQPTSTAAVPDDPNETELCYISRLKLGPTQSTSSSSISPDRPTHPTTPRSPARRTSIYGTCANEFLPSLPPLHRDSRLGRASRRESSWSIEEEIACYEAEAAWLARENQKLRMRVRILEKQITAAEPTATGEGQRDLTTGNLEIPSPLLEAMHKR